MAVGSIYRKLGALQTITSVQLAILRKEGLVTAEREGRCIWYSVNYKRLEEIGQAADRLLNFDCEDLV
jgi:DNA-binding transcriptional ArsR family regulator